MVALADVLWIGGPSGAGKSTTARLVARRHGLGCFSTDTATWAHRDREVAAGNPKALAWERLAAGRRQALPPAEQLRFEFDRWPYVLADVDALPASRAVIVEGTVVTPDRLPAGSAAVWLTAAPRARAERTARRGWGDAGGGADTLKTSLLEDQLATSGATRVDTTYASPSVTVADIERAAEPWLTRQTGVTSPIDRQALRRDINIALVKQHRSGWNRRGQRPDTSGAVRALECECADPFCTEFVLATVATLPDPFGTGSPPIIATPHRWGGLGHTTSEQRF